MLRRREERFDERPLVVREVGWVGSPHRRISYRGVDVSPLSDRSYGDDFFTDSLLDSIDISRRLSKGRHTVIFFHHDCAKCEEVIAQAAKRFGGQESSVVLIEVPTFDGMMRGARPEWNSSFVVGGLAASRRWVVETPQVLTLDNGVVIESKREFRLAESNRPSKE